MKSSLVVKALSQGEIKVIFPLQTNYIITTKFM